MILSHVSSGTGRLLAYPPLVGFLLPEEIRRVSTLLSGTVVAGAYAERDRQILLRVLAVAIDAGCGLYWLAT